jgi:hypothetical protein
MAAPLSPVAVQPHASTSALVFEMLAHAQQQQYPIPVPMPCARFEQGGALGQTLTIKVVANIVQPIILADAKRLHDMAKFFAMLDAGRFPHDWVARLSAAIEADRVATAEANEAKRLLQDAADEARRERNRRRRAALPVDATIDDIADVLSKEFDVKRGPRYITLSNKSRFGFGHAIARIDVTDGSVRTPHGSRAKFNIRQVPAVEWDFYSL